MEIRDTISVNGFTVNLVPYTEKRMRELNEVLKEIDEFVKENSDMLYDDIPNEKKVNWWMRKARILWNPEYDPALQEKGWWDKKEGFFSKEFFDPEHFEYPQLQKSEVFFRNQRLYL